MTAAVDMFGEVVRQVSAIVHKIAGIQLNADQHHMVQSRVRSRMISLGINSPEQYLLYLNENHQTESEALVSLITTHHSFFFRESVHFEFMERTSLTQLINIARSRNDKKIRIWSAACSRGQEAYSLAMFFSFHLGTAAKDVDFEILATDVDPESLKIAENGVYAKQELNRVPLAYLSNHWSKGSGDIKDFVAARDSLRTKIKWSSANLLEFGNKIGPHKFDLIFCRNVFIYFNKDQIKSCVNNLFEVLEPHGKLFIGVSESLGDISSNIVNLGFSIYGRPLEGTAIAKTQEGLRGIAVSPSPESMSPSAALPRQSRIRVVCVDDSDSILVLLKYILTNEHGFEVVGTAPNGQAAIDVIAKLKPDIVTLDIHMPEMDGVQYMETQFHANHPPVVVISSVPREEANLAIRALKSGASDYVEKPTLNNLTEHADEIRSKLYMAANSGKRGTNSSNLDQAFAKHIKLENPDKKVRFIVASMSHTKDVNIIFSQLQDEQCPTIILVDGSDSILEAFTKELKCGRYACIGVLDSANAVGVNQVGVMQFKSSIEKARQETSKNKVVVCLLGMPSQTLINKLSGWSNAALILEDMDANRSKNYEKAREMAADVMPVASMAYMSTLILNNK